MAWLPVQNWTGNAVYAPDANHYIGVSKLTWNHHECGQNNSFENVFQRFAWSFVSFLWRKHDFGGRIYTFVWQILFKEPRIWTSGFNLWTRVLKSVTAAQECLDMHSGCHAAKLLLPVNISFTRTNNWKMRLFPKPVGRTANKSCLDNSVVTACFCSDRNLSDIPSPASAERAFSRAESKSSKSAMF